MTSIGHSTYYDTSDDTMQVAQLVAVIEGAMLRDELQEKLTINNRYYFRKAYINEALNKGFIEMTIPDKPKSKTNNIYLQWVYRKCSISILPVKVF